MRIKWKEMKSLGLPTLDPQPYYSRPPLYDGYEEPLFFEGETTLEKWLSTRPFISTYDYCDGGSEYSLRILFSDGESWREVLPWEEDYRYANQHTPDIHHDGVTVGEWLAQNPNFKPIAILTRSRAWCSWEGEDEGPDWSLYLLQPLPDEQVRRVRRRIEDWLRKEASPEVIMGLASTFGLKLD